MIVYTIKCEDNFNNEELARITDKLKQLLDSSLILHYSSIVDSELLTLTVGFKDDCSDNERYLDVIKVLLLQIKEDTLSLSIKKSIDNSNENILYNIYSEEEGSCSYNLASSSRKDDTDNSCSCNYDEGSDDNVAGGSCCLNCVICCCRVKNITKVFFDYIKTFCSCCRSKEV